MTAVIVFRALLLLVVINSYVAAVVSLNAKGIKTWWSSRPQLHLPPRDRAASIWATHVSLSLFVEGAFLLISNQQDLYCLLLPFLFPLVYVGVRKLALRFMPEGPATNRKGGDYSPPSNDF